MVNPCTESSLGIGVILAITFLAICLVFAGLLAWYFFRKWRATKLLSLTHEEIEYFMGKNSATENNTSEPEELPYEESYELLEDSFYIDRSQVLGIGCYSSVFGGKVYNYQGECVFKTLDTRRRDIEPYLLTQLLTELKMMMYIGPHDNILKLIGAYTKDIQAGTLCIAFEFCKYGSLGSCLQKIKPEIVGDFSFFRRTNNFLKFIRWCEEIANGMDYLSSKQIIHMDLAARNILLGEGEVVKISDFKMSHRMHNDNEYVKSNQEPMPWKWMAIESLKKMIFSTQTDVWAYGITIWEIFSVGKDPYLELSFTKEFVDRLNQGLRNEKPEYCSTEIYDIMLSCWNINASGRPEFSALRTFFNELVLRVIENYEKQQK